jgi:ribulose-5-phosphate 4-epimerase/fuculose-1-phosphate aldolase
MAEERPGGLAAWAPRAIPGIGQPLTAAQELAIALRHLDEVGFVENLTGHITVADGEHFLVNPWGLWWREVRACDILTIDTAGRVVTGDWDVTPAVHIHTELHRQRPDAQVIVHNHPPYAATLAAVGELPDLVHQNSSILSGEMVLVDDFDGEVDAPHLGAALAGMIGRASVALLVSHGVIVTAPTLAEAVYKSVLFERTCMLHWQVRAYGGKARPLPATAQRQLKTSLIERAAPVYWNGVVRDLLARLPEVLD